MTTLTRWDPFREMMALRSTMDQLFNDTFRSMDWQSNQESLALPLEIAETKEAFVVTAAVPGIEPGALDITLSDNLLTITGEFKPQEAQEDVRYHLSEHQYGKFSRTITLPTAVQADQITANYHNGLVSITLPKAEAAKPKRIPVQSNGHKTIEGQRA
jgi:HSP20 family protein